MKNTILLLTAFLWLSFSVYSQKTTLINSGKIITEGITLYDEEKYEDALKQYQLVDRNDTNYSWALVEKAIAYNALKEYRKAINTCNEALLYSTDDYSNIYNTLGTAYDEMEQRDSAIIVYQKGLKGAPYNHLLYFNIAITYLKMEKWDSLIIYAKKAIDYNIYHPSSHYFLGYAYYKRQMYAQAMLPLQMFLLLEPASNRSNYALNMLIDIANMNEIEAPTNFELAPEDNIFDNINFIIKSKVALNEKYTTPVKKLKDPLVNQLYVLLEKLESSDDITNFWHRNYTHLFKEIYNKNKFEPHVYAILAGLENKKIQADVKKKNKEIMDFQSWANQIIIDVRKTRYLNYDGKLQKVTTWYDKKNRITALGELKNPPTKDPVYIGRWEFFNSSGAPSTIAHFNNSGERIDTWTYFYPNGTLKEEITYKEGLVYIDKYYNKYGALLTTYEKTEGDKTYSLKKYYNTEQLFSDEKLVNDKKNGAATYYYASGEKRYDFTYKDNEETGSTEYYYDGSIKHKTTQKGVLSFESFSYFKNGTISAKGDFVKDKSVGEWKWFYEDGKTKNIQKFDSDGNLTDSTFEYHKNGKLAETSFYSKGKLNGITKAFADDGKLHYETVYKNGDVISYKYYDKGGKITSQGEAKKGAFELKIMTPNGKVISVGNIVNNKKEGPWKYFTINGALEKEVNYVNDLENGLIKTYYTTGELHTQYSMKDGKAEGYYTRYYANGNVDLEGWYKNNLYEGYWYSYNALGFLSSINYYIKSNEQGYQQTYRNDGTLDYERYIDDDLITKYIFFDTTNAPIDTVLINKGKGVVKRYSKDKKLIEEFNIVNGMISGEYKYYHNNGKILSDILYARGKRDGMMKQYDYKGNLLFEGNYKEGDSEGPYKWYKDKKLEVEGEYKNDNRVGIRNYYNEAGKIDLISIYDDEGNLTKKTYYSEKGELMLVKNYKDDEIYSYTYQDKDGVLIPEIMIENGTGKIVSYYQNGNRSVEEEYSLGNLKGTILRYHSNGNIYIETPVKYEGLTEGTDKEYWANGKLKSEIPNKYNNKEGQCRFYREDGSLERIESYQMDDKHGEWQYFDAKGKVIKTEKYLYNVFIE